MIEILQSTGCQPEENKSNVRKLAVFGKPVSRVDGLSKVTGEVKYLDDLLLPGMLFGKILRSPYPSAKILSVDTSEAVRLKGVRAVIVAEDTPQIPFSFVPALADKLMLCKEYVRYVGDEVAAVAADDPVIAENALRLIKVEYEPMQPVFDPEEALVEDAPLVHRKKDSNIADHTYMEFGDSEAVFAKADYVVEDRYRTSKVAHCCLETRGCIAHWEQSGKLKLWAPSQCPHTLRRELSRALGISVSNIQVISPAIGGAFGSRLVMDMKEPIAALLSKRTGRPVKIVNTREEEFATARSRYPFIIDLKTAVDKEGKILARQVKIISDNGAYTDKGTAVVNSAAQTFATLYNPRALKYDALLVYTNKSSGTAFRGMGNPQAHFAVECQMDKIARLLKLDPKELRLRNCHYPDQETYFGPKITSCAMKECIEQASQLAGWERKEELKTNCGTKRVGMGMAVMIYTGGGHRSYGYNAMDTFIKISDDGNVTVITPAVEIGQGSHTVVAQITAEVLGIEIEKVRVISGDTEVTPYDLGVFGSRLVFLAGNAAKAAAEDARKEIAEIAAVMLNVSEDCLIFKKGKVFPCDHEEKDVLFSEIVIYAINSLGRSVSGRGRYVDRAEQGSNNIYPTYTFACQIAEVEVDIETGQVKVRKMTAAHDTGKTVNPSMAEGQVAGALIQGIGFALSEQQVIDNHGRIINNNFLDYKIYRAGEIPSISIALIESNDPKGPFGAKGIGEPGLIPVAPAIVNAVSDALGIEIKELPVTPTKIITTLGLT